MATAAEAAPAAVPIPAAPNGKPQPSETELLQHKLFGVLSGSMTSSLIGLGDKLGLYAKMKELGKASSRDIAETAGLNERFVREWLYQQASAGIVSTDKNADAFWLTEAQQAVLANEHGPDASPFFMGGFFNMAANMTSSHDTLLDTFRTGKGFTYDGMGDEAFVCATCRALGVWVRHFLVDRLAAVPGLKEKLEAGATIGDVGCGAGEVLFTLAKAFPKGKYVGYDISTKALDVANARKQEADNRDLDITFCNPQEEAQGFPNAPTYDLIITMDAVHDMARPDKVLPLVRKALKDDGAYIINDPRGMPTPAQNIAEAPDQATLFYGFSCHCCLPSGMSEEGAIGLGTLGFQEKQARELGAASGFTGFENLDQYFQNPFNNVFMLTP